MALHLAYTGTIKEDLLPTLEIGYEFLKTLIKQYLPNLIERYKIEQKQIEKIIQNNDLQENEKVLQVMEEIGRKRGNVIAGGEIDLERVANILLEDFRSGKLGKITLEKVK